jgi:hypothetical protein
MPSAPADVEAPLDPAGAVGPINAAAARRIAARERLRADLKAARADLRMERARAAAEAATRPPRWRAARSATSQSKGCPTHLTRPESTTDLTAPGTLSTALVAENAPAPANTCGASSSVFAALLGDLEASAKLSSDTAAGKSKDAASGTAAECLKSPHRSTPPAPTPGPGEQTVAMQGPHACDEEEVAIAAIGPGMLARLRRIGYAHFTDLATAQPEALRTALGDRNRRLDIEGWIGAAERIVASQTRSHTTP